MSRESKDDKFFYWCMIVICCVLPIILGIFGIGLSENHFDNIVTTILCICGIVWCLNRISDINQQDSK